MENDTLNTRLVSQAQIRRVCGLLEVPISNALFYFHKSKGHFPSADLGDKDAKYSLYYYPNALDIINMWLSMQSIEMPQEFITDKLLQVITKND